jgi:hypothetical protein
MTDIRTMFEKDFLGAWNLEGDTTVTIKGVKAAKIKNAQDKENKKPIIAVAEFDKPFVCNSTNAETISALYGRHVEQWVGKRITLYPAQVQAFGKMNDCIRVRPQAPAASRSAPGLAFIDADGVEHKFAKGSEWLAHVEKTLADADAASAGKLWDTNQDAFYAVQTAATKANKPELIDQVAALGKSWNAKINETLAAE